MPVETTASQSSSDFVGLWKKAASWYTDSLLAFAVSTSNSNSPRPSSRRSRPRELGGSRRTSPGKPRKVSGRLTGKVLLRRPERGAAAGAARKRAGEHLVLGRHRRQHDVAHRPVPVDERLEEREAPSSARPARRRRGRPTPSRSPSCGSARARRRRRTAGQGPHLAGHRLAHQRLQLAVRRQRQRGPQVPVGGGRELRALVGAAVAASAGGALQQPAAVVGCRRGGIVWLRSPGAQTGNQRRARRARRARRRVLQRLNASAPKRRPAASAPAASVIRRGGDAEKVPSATCFSSRAGSSQHGDPMSQAQARSRCPRRTQHPHPRSRSDNPQPTSKRRAKIRKSLTVAPRRRRSRRRRPCARPGAASCRRRAATQAEAHCCACPRRASRATSAR